MWAGTSTATGLSLMASPMAATGSIAPLGCFPGTAEGGSQNFSEEKENFTLPIHLKGKE